MCVAAPAPTIGDWLLQVEQPTVVAVEAKQTIRTTEEPTARKTYRAAVAPPVAHTRPIKVAERADPSGALLPHPHL